MLTNTSSLTAETKLQIINFGLTTDEPLRRESHHCLTRELFGNKDELTLDEISTFVFNTIDKSPKGDISGHKMKSLSHLRKLTIESMDKNSPTDNSEEVRVEETPREATGIWGSLFNRIRNVFFSIIAVFYKPENNEKNSNPEKKPRELAEKNPADVKRLEEIEKRLLILEIEKKLPNLSLLDLSKKASERIVEDWNTNKKTEDTEDQKKLYKLAEDISGNEVSKISGKEGNHRISNLFKSDFGTRGHDWSCTVKDKNTTQTFIKEFDSQAFDKIIKFNQSAKLDELQLLFLQELISQNSVARLLLLEAYHNSQVGSIEIDSNSYAVAPSWRGRNGEQRSCKKELEVEVEVLRDEGHFSGFKCHSKMTFTPNFQIESVGEKNLEKPLVFEGEPIIATLDYDIAYEDRKYTVKNYKTDAM